MREQQHVRPSFREVVETLIRDLYGLLQSEIDLAKSEVGKEVRKLRGAVLLLAAGTILVVFAAGFYLLAIVYELSVFMSPWFAALIVATGTLLVAGLVVWRGWRKLSTVDFKPSHTIQSIKENVTWLKTHLK